MTIDDRISLRLRGQQSLVLGTVRFIGSVPGKRGASWYGVELDAAIGQTDGRWNEREHFRCALKRGVLVKRSQIHRVERPNAAGPRVAIGSAVRIQSAKFQGMGTVRYLGIPSFKRLYDEGNWYGVAMDTASGRHDGAVGGVSYFECSGGRGLFVTADQIEPHHDEMDDDFKSESVDLAQSPKLRVFRMRSASSSTSSSTNRHRMRPRSQTIDRSKSSSKHRGLGQSVDSKTDAMVHRKLSGHHSSKSNLSDELEAKESEQYQKRYIITESGYSVSLLLSDQRLNVEALRIEIINTFGHLEDLENEQIEIKIVDKMCVLVRITFRRSASFEKGLFPPRFRLHFGVDFTSYFEVIFYVNFGVHFG